MYRTARPTSPRTRKRRVRGGFDRRLFYAKNTAKYNAAAKSAVKQMLATFFDDSASKAVAVMLNVSAAKLTKEELDRMRKLIDGARKANR